MITENTVKVILRVCFLFFKNIFKSSISYHKPVRVLKNYLPTYTYISLYKLCIKIGLSLTRDVHTRLLTTINLILLSYSKHLSIVIFLL